MTERGPLPFTVQPYPSEALHSWLTRLAVPYRLKPWQLLHELGVGTFAERNAGSQHPVQAFLDVTDLRRLAHLTHTDPSRFGLDRLCPTTWSLASDEWIMRCRGCEQQDRRDGIATYERAAWRNAARTFCQRHREPLILGIAVVHDDEGPEETATPLTELETAIAIQLRAFEYEIEEAWRGRAPASAAGTLNANDFLIVAQDLLTFAAATWDTDSHCNARTIDQHAMKMGFHGPTLFRYASAKSLRFHGDAGQPMQLRHLADPAARRAALWLVLQVIWYVPARPPPLELRLGNTPQDHFFGSRRHSGWAWLTQRASAWPIQYRERHWHGFVDAADTLKVQVTPLKG